MAQSPSFDVRFRDAFEALNRDGASALRGLTELYDPYVVFQDPLQTLYGRDEFEAFNRRVLERCTECHVTLSTLTERDSHLFATWTMTLAFRVGPRLTLEGATHAQIRDGLITYQRDYWDVLGTVADAIPGVNLIYRRLMSMLG